MGKASRYYGVDDILYNYVRFDFHSVCNDCLEEYASEAYDEYLEGYVERATVCGILITGFIINVISGILLYNNFNNRFSTVKDSLQKQQELQLEDYQKKH